MSHHQEFVRLVMDAKTRIKEVSIHDVKHFLDKKEAFYLVDVRETEEWDEGNIPNAIHLSRGILERDIGDTIEDKQAEIVLYCGGGFRSALAADELQKMGYVNVKSMDGGIRAWRGIGYPLESN